MSENNITRVKLDPNKVIYGETDWDQIDALTDEDVEAAALSDPDCPPLSPEQLKEFRRIPDVAAIRRTLNMSQKRFADTFHLSLGTLRDWEQHNHVPDKAAQTLLTVIAKNPEAVIQALGSSQSS